MEMGLFLPTGNNGWICSQTSPQYLPSFELGRDIAQRAERYGMTFAMTMVKLRGFGGPTKFWDYNLETTTLISALCAVTERIKLWSSIAIPTLHPAMVARMAATIDSVAPGRYGINIVSGWNRSEYAQMGLWPGDDYWDYRYDYATEYVTILRELWETGQSDFKGKYFQLDDCRVEPRPTGKVTVVAAGASPRGRQFAGELADLLFSLSPPDREGMIEANRTVAEAGAAAGRTLRSLHSRMVILDDTDEAARRKVDRYNDGTDHVALANWNAQYAKDEKGTSSQISKERKQAVGATTGKALVGSAETVAEHLNTLLSVKDTGGLMFIFDDYVEGLDRFGQEVMPLLDWTPDVETPVPAAMAAS